MKYTKELHNSVRKALGHPRASDLIGHAPETLAALLDEIEQLQSERKWIPVSERLPENKQDVFVLNKYGDCKARTYLDDGDIRWWLHSDDNYCDELEYATHWMPLPPPPPEEK